MAGLYAGLFYFYRRYEPSKRDFQTLACSLHAMGMAEPLSLPFWEIAAMVTLQTLLSLVLFSAAVGILVFLIRKPIRRYKPFDLAIFDNLKPWISPQKNQFMLFITFLGKHQFLIPANLLLIAYFLFIRHQTWSSIRMLTIALSSLVLMLLLKALFQRKRPLSPLLNAARGLSFPSGHAIMSVTFYGLVLYILIQEAGVVWLKILLGILLVVLIILIGYSRVYLRVHYASDVLAGFVIGFLWLMISLFVLNRVEEYSSAETSVSIGNLNSDALTKSGVSVPLPYYGIILFNLA